MTKLSDLKVGDKLRFRGETIYKEYVREYCGFFNGKHVVTVSEPGYGTFNVSENVEVELITDPQEPKYRPFANADEFRPHRDRWLRWKDDDSAAAVSVGTYSDIAIWPGSAQVGTIWEQAVEQLVFDDDGTPCGELVE